MLARGGADDGLVVPAVHCVRSGGRSKAPAGCGRGFHGARGTRARIAQRTAPRYCASRRFLPRVVGPIVEMKWGLVSGMCARGRASRPEGAYRREGAGRCVWSRACGSGHSSSTHPRSSGTTCLAHPRCMSRRRLSSRSFDGAPARSTRGMQDGSGARRRAPCAAEQLPLVCTFGKQVYLQVRVVAGWRREYRRRK